MSWNDFFVGANNSFDSGAQIGTDAYLKKLAAKIQARNQDKQNLWDSIQSDKERRFRASEADRQRKFLEAENEKTRTTNIAKDNTTIDTEYLKVLQKPKSEWTEQDRSIVDAYERKNFTPKEKPFNADEMLYNTLGPEKWIQYKLKGGADGTTDARKPEQARQMAQDIIGKEEGGLPKQVESLQSDPYSDPAQLEAAKGQLNAVRAGRPGGLPALTDSLRLGQGQYATPEQQNQQVSPEQAASVTQELATLKQQLAEILKSLGAKQ